MLSKRINTIAARVITVQYRQFGITDMVTNFATGKVQNEKEKKFTAMMETMISKPKWSMRDWKTSLDDQLNSWMMYVPGMKNSAESKDMKIFKEIMEAMPASYLDDPSTIDGKAKEQICRSSGKTMEDVMKMMTYFNQSLIVQRWLTMKKQAGETMPENEADFAKLQANDVRMRGIAMKVMKSHKTGRSRKISY